VAEFTGMENTLAGRVSGQCGELWRIQIGDCVLYAQGADPAGADVLLCIRADEVGLRALDGAGSPGLLGATNRLAGRVTEIASLGAISRVTVDCGFALVGHLTNRNMRELGLSPGREVLAEIEAGSIHLLRCDATDRIAFSQARQGAETAPIPQSWGWPAKGRV
jgi:ABC-type molybdate transport system ATPase subunit